MCGWVTGISEADKGGEVGGVDGNRDVGDIGCGVGSRSGWISFACENMHFPLIFKNLKSMSQIDHVMVSVMRPLQDLLHIRYKCHMMPYGAI